MNAPSHSQFRRLVQDSLDGPLVEAEQRLLASHLETCPECRRYAAELGSLQTGLSRLMKKRWTAGSDPETQNLQNIQVRARRIAMRKWVFRIAGGVVVIGIFIFVFSGILSGLGSRSPSQPAAGSSVPETATLASDTTSEACRTVTYTVQPNDTLSVISTNYHVTVEAIREWNGFTNNTLTPGMALIISLCKPTGTPQALATDIPPVILKDYVVQAGDTCGSIAALFNVPLSNMIQLNHLNPACSDLTIGQDLKIPVSAEIDAAAAAFPITGPGACSSIEVNGKGTGIFIWPSSKHYISGMDFDPKNYHFGLDLAANLDDAIVAADTGTVIYAGGNDWGYGNLVVLDHGNGYMTYYAHLDRLKVDCGQKVSQGDLIGLAGSTGNSYGPHLHFEIVLNGKGIDPWTVLPRP